MSTRPESEQEAAPTSEPPRGFRRSLRHIGPGIIVSGSIVGSGELIVTTKLGAEVGFILLWLILFSCFIKVFLQIEFGRQVIATGATTLQALDRIPGPRVGFRLFGMRCQGNWLVWLWAAMALCSVFQLGGILLGLVQVFDLEALNLGGVPTQVWLGATVSVSVGILVTGRYRHIERTATWMVFLFTGITILTLLLLQGSPEYAVSTAELGSGLSLSFPDEGLLTGLAVLGITGVGASELIFYPYWCLEKGYARHVGPPDGSVEWTRRARGWIRVMRIDVWVSFAVYTTATVAFYLLGASTLHRRGLVPDDDELHQSLSYMYTAGFGEAAGSWVYLLGAIAVLFSTFFVAMASNSRFSSASFMSPTRSRSLGTLASLASRRRPICSLPISRLKTPTTAPREAAY